MFNSRGKYMSKWERSERNKSMAVLFIVGAVFFLVCAGYYQVCLDSGSHGGSVGVVSGDDNSQQVNAIRAMSFRNIQLYSDIVKVNFACAKDDSAFNSSGFTATNMAGESVEGVVCCGLFFKGCTVRF